MKAFGYGKKTCPENFATGASWRATQMQDLTFIGHRRGISDIEVKPLMVYEKNCGAIAIGAKILLEKMTILTVRL